MSVVVLEDQRGKPAKPVTVRDVGDFSARNTSKGALIDESARVFAAIASGTSVDEVHEQSLCGTLLNQRSFINRRRIWTSIQQRYLIPEMPWITDLLAEKCSLGAHSAEFTSLLYFLYSLRDRLTFEFVTTVLWPKGYRAQPAVSREDVLDLLASATKQQPQIDRWSESTRIKLAGSILTALRDFGVLKGKQKKFLIQPPLPLSTAEAILRILISEGRRGRQVLEDPTWRLFFLTEAEVAQVLGRLAQVGTIRFEKAGTTVVLDTPVAWEMAS